MADSKTAIECRRLILEIDQMLHAELDGKHGGYAAKAHKALHELAHAFEQHEGRAQ
jgi:hypothetical protein